MPVPGLEFFLRALYEVGELDQHAICGQPPPPVHLGVAIRPCFSVGNGIVSMVQGSHRGAIIDHPLQIRKKFRNEVDQIHAAVNHVPLIWHLFQELSGPPSKLIKGRKKRNLYMFCLPRVVFNGRNRLS